MFVPTSIMLFRDVTGFPIYLEYDGLAKTNEIAIWLFRYCGYDDALFDGYTPELHLKDAEARMVEQTPDGEDQGSETMEDPEPAAIFDTYILAQPVYLN